jgi:hypothetical protein
MESPARALQASLQPLRRYEKPKLTCYGEVRTLTQASSSAPSAESAGNPSKCTSAKSAFCTSDRRAKENIVLVDRHTLGFGLYLFDYKEPYRALFGASRQFGVMADEVERVMPEAVQVQPDGLKFVNYELLGIVRHVH